MGLSDLLGGSKKSKNDDLLSIAKSLASNKDVQNAASKVAKIAKDSGIDLTKIVMALMTNKTVITALGKLGAKKDSDPTSAAVQKLVGSLQSSINKATGVKVDDNSFSSIVNKLMGNKTIKTQVEDIAGDGVSSFIKKAVAAYIS